MNPEERKIIHVDMDCFFAAIEVRDNPRLKGKAVAVGGRPEGRGVISTCNYEARKFGVHSALSSREAVRRCPQLILLPSRFSTYREESQKIREIFSRYTSLIEPLSLDEAYLDVTNCSQLDGSATQIAAQIRRQIEEETGLTASAGISNSKFVAKVACEWKKPNGQWTVPPKDVFDFVSKLNVAKIPGVGKATQKKMKRLKLETCADLQKLEKAQLIRHFGRWGERLYNLSRGIDFRSVKTSRERKSLSVERTYSKDFADWKTFEKKMEKIYEEFVGRFGRSTSSVSDIKGFSIKMRYENFESITRDRQWDGIPPFEEVLKLCKLAYEEDSRPIRLLGMGVKLASKKKKLDRHQLNLF